MDKEEELYCTCDLKVGECDVDCCCDRECTEADAAAFSDCRDREMARADLSYCFTTEFLFANNTRVRKKEVCINHELSKFPGPFLCRLL